MPKALFIRYSFLKRKLALLFFVLICQSSPHSTADFYQNSPRFISKKDTGETKFERRDICLNIQCRLCLFHDCSHNCSTERKCCDLYENQTWWVDFYLLILGVLMILFFPELQQEDWFIFWLNAVVLTLRYATFSNRSCVCTVYVCSCVQHPS